MGLIFWAGITKNVFFCKEETGVGVKIDTQNMYNVYAHLDEKMDQFFSGLIKSRIPPA